jgi:hypothetical protein
VKHVILALLAATLPLSATAATNLNSSKSNVTEEQAATTVKSGKSNSSEREQAQTASDCDFAIDQKGVKRLAQHEATHTAQQGTARRATELDKPKCETDRQSKDAVVK